ncbi:MAG TPA: HYR domain-containing protein [Phycisphaerae bacterium]|nr:HYR domain-containing protein [Phycisphaerae bacterium]
MSPACLLGVSVCALLLASATAWAAPVFFSSRGTTLYRFTLVDPGAETFAMPDRAGALAADAEGTVWIAGRLNPDQDTFFELYVLDNPCGLPQLRLIGDFFPRPVDSMTFIGDTLYITYLDDTPFHYLAAVDIDAETVTVVGDTGHIGARAESTAFDAATSTLYCINNGTVGIDDPFLRIVDWQLLNGSNPSATTVGPTGRSSWTSGGDFFGGEYYHLVSYVVDSSGHNIELGTIDTATATFTPVKLVDSGVPTGTIGLAVIDVDLEGGEVCPLTGACCLSDQGLGEGDGCEVLSQATCINLGGEYLGDDAVCDSDGDGVTDCDDACPGTAAETEVNEAGCSCDQIEDTEPPVFNICPEDFEVFAEGCTYIIGDYTQSEGPVASDNSEPLCELTITQTPPPGTEVGPGDTDVVVTATDEHGNSATCNFTITVLVDECECGLDDEDPVITSCPEDDTLDGGRSCTATLPDYTGDVEAGDNCTSQPEDENNNGNENNGNTSVGAASNLTITQDPEAGTSLPPGDTTVTITVADEAGNTATCTLTVTVTVDECACGLDDEPPVITSCPEGDTLQADVTCTATLPDYTAQIEATDNCTTQPADDNNNENDDTALGGESGFTITQDPEAGTVVPVGQTVVTITVADEQGNTDTCEFTVTVEQGDCLNPCAEDTLPPLVACPEDFSLAAGEDCLAALPDVIAQAKAGDNCTAVADLIVTQDPEAGTPLSVGDHVVTIQAEDEAGNVGSCEFTVTVTAGLCDPCANDTTPPEIETCPDDRTLLADADCEARVPDLTGEVVASDNCPTGESGLTITQSPAAGETIGVGDTVVTLTVTDTAGNEAFCEVTLTVDENGCNDPGENPNGNNNNNNNGNTNTNGNVNGNTNTNNNSNENTPGGQPVPPCDPDADDSLNLLFSLLFHAPVCGSSCPLMIGVTLCGFFVMRHGAKRQRKR